MATAAGRSAKTAARHCLRQNLQRIESWMKLAANKSVNLAELAELVEAWRGYRQGIDEGGGKF